MTAIDEQVLDNHASHAVEVTDSHDRSRRGINFRALLVICLALTVPTLVFSAGLQHTLGLPGPRFPGSEFVAAAFGIAVLALGGRVFLSGAIDELRARSLGMMTLASLALVVAFAYSLSVLLGFPGRDFWWQLSVLVTILLLGHWIQTRVIASKTAGSQIVRAQIVDAQIAETRASRSAAQLLADRAAGILFFVALGVAALTLVAWLLLRPDDPAFVAERVVTALVIASPSTLALAIPLVVVVSAEVGARHGILVRIRAALEGAKDVDVVLVNKTGTLTSGRQVLVSVTPARGVDEAEALGLAAAVESKSEHPIARAIVAAAEERGVKVPRSSKFASIAGRGASATVGGRDLHVGSSRVVSEAGIHLDPTLVHAMRDAHREGATVVHLLEGDAVLASFALADVIRPESAEAVAALQKRGVRVAMLTGDSHEVAHFVAGRLGITEVFAEVLPAQKSATVEKLQERGIHRVAMVGDGVNDAPALARADIGIAIGAGTDVAIESAGVVLASDDPRGVVDILTLSRAGYRKMLQNLAWATGYNLVGLPLAAGVLAGVGFLMPPAVGAVVMAVSTIVVALNAQWLRRLRFRR
jgi:Cu2+-exporting ATPase